MFGREIPSSRMTAWYGDPGVQYTYSGITLRASQWLPPLLKIKRRIDDASGEVFNGVLANFYMSSRDSMDWHSDNEPELGDQPVIASVSFGAARIFKLRHTKERGVSPLKYILENGDLFIMRGETQKFWKHQVPKTRETVRARINLSYRRIMDD
jgi:alkylated DNA repair dioxygenase AlkB